MVLKILRFSKKILILELSKNQKKNFKKLNFFLKNLKNVKQKNCFQWK